MTTNIGRIDDLQLEKNVQKIVASIRAGRLSKDEAIQHRIDEYATLKKMKKSAGNNARMDYIVRETQRIMEVLDA
jgi:hypothetical protein